jgi:hypothetical protein
MDDTIDNPGESTLSDGAVGLGVNFVNALAPVEGSSFGSPIDKVLSAKPPNDLSQNDPSDVGPPNFTEGADISDSVEEESSDSAETTDVAHSVDSPRPAADNPNVSTPTQAHDEDESGPKPPRLPNVRLNQQNLNQQNL